MQYRKITLHRILHGIKWRWEHRRWDVLYPICCKIFPVSTNKVCFISWNGAHFNCNPKAIATYVAEHNYDDNIARWVPPVALLWYRCFMRTNISYHSCGTAHI